MALPCRSDRSGRRCGNTRQVAPSGLRRDPLRPSVAANPPDRVHGSWLAHLWGLPKMENRPVVGTAIGHGGIVDPASPSSEWANANRAELLRARCSRTRSSIESTARVVIGRIQSISTAKPPIRLVLQRLRRGLVLMQWPSSGRWATWSCQRTGRRLTRGNTAMVRASGHLPSAHAPAPSTIPNQTRPGGINGRGLDHDVADGPTRRDVPLREAVPDSAHRRDVGRGGVGRVGAGVPDHHGRPRRHRRAECRGRDRESGPVRSDPHRRVRGPGRVQLHPDVPAGRCRSGCRRRHSPGRVRPGCPAAGSVLRPQPLRRHHVTVDV